MKTNKRVKDLVKESDFKITFAITILFTSIFLLSCGSQNFEEVEELNKDVAVGFVKHCLKRLSNRDSEYLASVIWEGGEFGQLTFEDISWNDDFPGYNSLSDKEIKNLKFKVLENGTQEINGNDIPYITLYCKRLDFEKEGDDFSVRLVGKKLYWTPVKW